MNRNFIRSGLALVSVLASFQFAFAAEQTASNQNLALSDESITANQQSLAPADQLEETLLNQNELTTEVNSFNRGGGWGNGHGHGHGHHHRYWVCYAKNRRGQWFQGTAQSPNRAQHEAMRSCYANRSRYCQPAGCRQM